MATWNPWHGCHKLSPGCMNCYVYRRDAKYELDSSVVKKTGDFDLPLKKTRSKEYKLTPDEVCYTCMTSDFFVEDADEWRLEAWQMIKTRNDLNFFIITKRIDRFNYSLPLDWKDGYDNVSICCTVENQDRANYRLPMFMNAPIKHKFIICEPILEQIDLLPYLNPTIEQVVVGGESGDKARLCNYDWVLDIRRQCIEKNVHFYFKQTGAKFIKDNRYYRIDRKFQQSQAKKANINI